MVRSGGISCEASPDRSGRMQTQRRLKLALQGNQLAQDDRRNMATAQTVGTVDCGLYETDLRSTRRSERKWVGREGVYEMAEEEMGRTEMQNML